MGGVCFSDMGGGSFLSGEYPMGAIDFGGGGGGFEKNQKMGGGAPPYGKPRSHSSALFGFLSFFCTSYDSAWTTLLDSDWFYDILELVLKSPHTILLDLAWFYMLDLDFKITWTNLLDSHWFCCNHAGMLLEKNENLLEFS